MRLIDSRLEGIRELLQGLLGVVSELVHGAATSIKEPSCGSGFDPEARYEEVKQLKEELQRAIAITYARDAPLATDLRFLFAVLASIPKLEHMGDCAKHVCQLASQIGSHSQGLLPLVTLAERSAGRREIEEVFNHALGELAEVGSSELNARKLELQVLVAFNLKEICDAAASIAEDLALCQIGKQVRAA